MTVAPFEIAVTDEALADLRERLARTRWPDEVEGAGWDYGTPLAFMKQLVAHWRAGFDWRALERRMNTLPQFRAEVGGLDLHFVHERGRGPRPMPLLLLHGWPSTFWQMARLVPLLADPGAHGGDAADAFDVVVPSLPGCGFSGRPSRPGMTRGLVVRPPAGFALFPGDTDHPPREWAERTYRVARWSEMPRGGHFAAEEEPELLAEELRDFFRPLRAG